MNTGRNTWKKQMLLLNTAASIGVALSANASTVVPLNQTSFGAALSTTDLSGIVTVNDFGGFVGLTVTATSSGTFGVSGPTLGGEQWRVSIPEGATALATDPSATISFTFDGGGIWDVTALTLSSNNNLFSRSFPSFMESERISVSVNSDGTWDSFVAVPGNQASDITAIGLGSSDAEFEMSLVGGSANSQGYTAIATGNLTSFDYTYDVENFSGNPPATVSQLQPFSASITVEPIPEPSCALLLGLGLCGCLARKRRS